MRPLRELSTVARLRKGLLAHVETMFEVVEELDWPGRGRRTRFLTEENWLKVKNAYDELDADFRALLIMGVALHDVGKLAQWNVHAHVGTDMVADLLRRVPIGETDLGMELGIGNEGRLPSSLVAELLQLLVKHHEVYGNLFTGEQSLLGLEPVMLALRTRSMDKFLNTMMLLTVVEVASQDSDGYLFNTRIKRYFSASNAVVGWVGKNQALSDTTAQASARQYLVYHDAAIDECVARIAGLAHSYSVDIDRDLPKYLDSVKRALGGVLPSSSDMATFAGVFARVRKLAYALRWCDTLSGGLQEDGSGKSIDGLRRLIGLLWIVTRPVACCSDSLVFEVRFPAAVNKDACRRLAGRLDQLAPLVEPGCMGIARTEPLGWQPVDGMSLRVVEDRYQEVVLDCMVT